MLVFRLFISEPGLETSRDVEEVIQRANSSHYGLAAGVFTQNIDAANTISRALKSRDSVG